MSITADLTRLAIEIEQDVASADDRMVLQGTNRAALMGKVLDAKNLIGEVPRPPPDYTLRLGMVVSLPGHINQVGDLRETVEFIRSAIRQIQRKQLNPTRA